MESWKASVLEAEAVLPEPLKKVLPKAAATETSCSDRSTSQEESKASDVPTSTTVAMVMATLGHLSSKMETLSKKPSSAKDTSKNCPQMKKKSPVTKKACSSTKKSSKVGEIERGNADPDTYTDIDSVPRILCPKAFERPSKPSQSQFLLPTETDTGKKPANKNFRGLWFSRPHKSSTEGANGATTNSHNGSFGELNSQKTTQGIPEDSAAPNVAGREQQALSLSASSRLMTRALKAMEERELKERTISTGNSGSTLEEGPVSAKSPSPPEQSESEGDSCLQLKSPKAASRERIPSPAQNRHLLKCASMKTKSPNGPMVKSEDEGCIISRDVVDSCAGRVTKEICVSDISSCSSPALSPTEVFQDGREISFKSLQDENSVSGKATTIRPDVNYKFSTFLMLLKDMHDSREIDGKPLVLTPGQSTALIKEEPSLIPPQPGEESAGGVEDGHYQQSWTLGSKKHNVEKGQGTALTAPSKSKHARPRPDRREEDGEWSAKKRPRKSRPSRAKKKTTVDVPLGDVQQASGKNRGTGQGGVPGSGSSLLAGERSRSQEITPDGYVQINCSNVAPKKRWQNFEAAAGTAAEAGGFRDCGRSEPGRASRDGTAHGPAPARSSPPKRSEREQTGSIIPGVAEGKDVSSGKYRRDGVTK